MDEKEILEIIKKLGKKLPKFPDGRIDYSNSDIAPVITVFLMHGRKIGFNNREHITKFFVWKRLGHIPKLNINERIELIETM